MIYGCTNILDCGCTLNRMEDQPPKRGRGRPATGLTPKHNLRIPDDIWNAAAERAKQERTTVTAVIVETLRRYGARTTRE